MTYESAINYYPNISLIILSALSLSSIVSYTIETPVGPSATLSSPDFVLLSFSVHSSPESSFSSLEAPNSSSASIASVSLPPPRAFFSFLAASLAF